MTEFGIFGDIKIDLDSDFVATAEVQRGPHNFFDQQMIADLASGFEALDNDTGCRAIVLCAEGKNFCAGANFGSKLDSGVPKNLAGKGSSGKGRHLYDEAVRLFSTRTPVVGAIQGQAVGGGLGLALMPDFRVASKDSKFSANFARLGFHHGFGLSATLPRIVGMQKALDLLYTGRRVSGEEAFEIGLCDRLVSNDSIRTSAKELAAEIATSGPLAVDSIRQTMRGDLAEAVRDATAHEKVEQDRLATTNDFKEGIKAMSERRPPDFSGT